MPENNDLKTDYRKYTKRKLLFIFVCIIVALAAVGLSLSVGARNIEFFEAYRILFDHLFGTTPEYGTIAWMDDHVIWNIRLPRALFAAIAGVGLAVAGTVMQSVMKNPLADPYTTGISSGACFGVAVSVVLGLSAFSSAGQFGAIFNAFIFAMIPMVLIIILAPISNRSPATLILAGVAISYLFNALTTLLLVTTDAENLADVYRWQIGSFVDIAWENLPLMISITLFGTIAILMLSKQLNLMALGDKHAQSMGLDPNTLRVVCLLIMSLMVASVIVFAGIIGFIGLISPHIVRMVIDADNKFVIPAAAAFGAAFLMSADVICRLLSDIDAIPVGVVVSFAGAPIFLYLIVTQRRSIW